MNYFLQESINLANHTDYLDELYRVYPIVPNAPRNLPQDKWDTVVDAFRRRDNVGLLKSLMDLEVFPIKDSYVAFLRSDKSALERNPRTVGRICGELYGMGLKGVEEECSRPKETNRQIGPLFSRWLKSGVLGIPSLGYDEFDASGEDAVLIGRDHDMKRFAETRLGYSHPKGLDFVARVNGRYVIGEAKFLSDFGGHQNAQLKDALATLYADADAEKVAILDGVCYLPKNVEMCNIIRSEENQNKNIMSALVLNSFLHSL